MIKVIFITNKLITGGVERALLSMIKQMPKEKFDITVGVCNLGGELEKSLSEDIKIIEIPEINDSIKNILIRDLINVNIIGFMKKIKNLIMCNLIRDYNDKCQYKSMLYNDLEEKYDIAICYHKPTDLPVSYVVNNIKANKKILWIHMEMNKISNHEKKGYYNLYKKYDEIICVSESVKNQMINIFPEFSEKLRVIYNFIDEIEIIKLSECGEKIDSDNGICNILTVGRLSVEKGHLLIIEAAIILKKNGVKFKWYLVGDGPSKGMIIKKINEYKLKDNIILLGNKDNPYGYFKSCDIYVQPSLEEGFGITVSEAKIFKKPIIVTKFGTAIEHVINYRSGYVVDFNGKEIAYRIEKLIKTQYDFQ